MTEFKKSRFTDSVFYDLEQTAKYAKVLGVQIFKKICPDKDIKAEEFGALDTILCNPGICQRDLAKLILKDRASTGRILDSLEYKGFITRFIDMKNNRLVRKMDVTEKGKEIIEEITTKTNVTFCDVQNAISEEEIANIRIGLKKLRDGLSEIVKIQI